MKTKLTLLLLFATSLLSNAQQTTTIAFDPDFINDDDKKLFHMSNYYSRKTKRNGQVMQRKHRIICFDPVTEKYQEINVKSIYSESQYRMQEYITVLDGDGHEHQLTPDSIEGFVTKGDYYLRKSITFNGEKRTHFLLRENMYRDEGIQIFSYEDKNRDEYYYVQFADDEEPVLMSGDNMDGGIGRIKEFMLKDPNANDVMTQKMIADMKPTASGVNKVYKALRAGGYTHLQRFRWGVSAVCGMSKVNSGSYALDAKPIATVGLFAEIPIASKVSIVPEIYFSHMSVKGSMENAGTHPSSVVYNRTEISMPLMVRYTHFTLRGNFLPYVQAGVAPSYGIKQNLDYRHVVEEQTNYGGANSHVAEGHEDVPGLQASVVAGVGTEWIVSSRHSLFFELRGVRGLSHLGRNDIMFVFGLKL